MGRNDRLEIAHKPMHCQDWIVGATANSRGSRDFVTDAENKPATVPVDAAIGRRNYPLPTGGTRMIEAASSRFADSGSCAGR
jgi:hypothetical protein